MIRSAASVASLSAVKQPWSLISFQTSLSISIGVTVLSPVSPPSTMVDWRCTQSTDLRIELGLPETSTTTSHISPLVSLRITSTTSSSSTLIVRVAPNFFASSRRGLSRPMPVTKIFAAPACLDANVQESPCWPGPWIKT